MQSSTEDLPKASFKNKNNPTLLRRSLGLLDTTALVVGCTIGVGIFRAAASMSAHLQSPGLILAAWGAGGVISFCGALCYSELGAAYPHAGGDYVYLTRIYSPAVGFLFGWAKIFTERIGTIAVLGFVFAEYLSFILHYDLFGTRIIASMAILFLTSANILGVHVGKRVQNFFTALKILALCGIIGVGLFSGAGKTALLYPLWPASFNGGTFGAFGVALVFVLWTYGGWAESTYVAEEVRHPEKTLPWSMLCGLAVVTVLYLIVNVVYLLYIPLAQMPGRRLVAAEVMQLALGPIGGTITALMVVCSAFGALNGFIMTSSRILLAIGRDHLLFAKLAHIHPRFATPIWALIFNGVGAIFLVWWGTFDQIVTYSTVVISLFFAMTALGVILLRIREPHAPRPYKVWGYPATPILFILAMVLFILDVGWMQPRETLFGFGLLACGIPLYFWSRRMGTSGYGMRG